MSSAVGLGSATSLLVVLSYGESNEAIPPPKLYAIAQSIELLELLWRISLVTLDVLPYEGMIPGMSARRNLRLGQARDGTNVLWAETLDLDPLVSLDVRSIRLHSPLEILLDIPSLAESLGGMAAAAGVFKALLVIAREVRDWPVRDRKAERRRIIAEARLQDLAVREREHDYLTRLYTDYLEHGAMGSPQLTKHLQSLGPQRELLTSLRRLYLMDLAKADESLKEDDDVDAIRGLIAAAVAEAAEGGELNPEVAAWIQQPAANDVIAQGLAWLLQRYDHLPPVREVLQTSD